MRARKRTESQRGKGKKRVRMGLEYPPGSSLSAGWSPKAIGNEYVRLKRFPPGFFESMVDWTTTQLRQRAAVRR